MSSGAPTTPWTIGGWEEYAGYDCMTPGVDILCDGKKVCTIDAANYDWNRCGLGSDVVGFREAIRARVMSTARLIAQSPNMLVALKQALPLVEAHARASLGEGEMTALIMRKAIEEAEK